MDKQRIAEIADRVVEGRERRATWGFEVPAKPVGAEHGRLTDVRADWRKVAKGLKDGNVSADIASFIRWATEKNSIALSRGETVHVEKTIGITLRMNLKSRPQELQVLVD